MQNHLIKYEATPFSSSEFNPDLGNKYFVGMNSNEHTSVITYVNTTAAVFSQDLALGIIFDTMNSAQKFIDNNNVINNVVPIRVSDVMKPIFYAKINIINNLPVIKTKKIWMDSDAPIGLNMYSDLFEAQNSLNKIKQTVIQFYQQNMITATMASFN